MAAINIGTNDDEGHDEDLAPVRCPSGATFWVFGRELNYYQDRARRYLEDNHFTNVSDLQDVDRMIMLETMCWRWSIWISQQKDYWHDPIDEDALQKRINATSVELRQIKSALGIDKVSRDKQRGEDSVAKYIENLKIRAKQFGINRESQLDKALELFQELSRLVTLHDNCTDDERLETRVDNIAGEDLRITTEDLLKWIREIAIPEYELIDAYFREHTQKLFIREM